MMRYSEYYFHIFSKSWFSFSGVRLKVNILRVIWSKTYFHRFHYYPNHNQMFEIRLSSAFWNTKVCINISKVTAGTGVHAYGFEEGL